MESTDRYVISTDPSRLDVPWIVAALNTTYWAASRSQESMERAIGNSYCFGAYEAATGQQVGFLRCITDLETFCWICDVVVEREHRGCGAGKLLVAAVIADARLQRATFHLGTRDAHGFYDPFGFVRHETMRRGAALNLS